MTKTSHSHLGTSIAFPSAEAWRVTTGALQIRRPCEKGTREQMIDYLRRERDSGSEVHVNRGERFKPGLRRERVNLAAVVIGAVDRVRPLLIDRGHHVMVALPPESVSIHANPVRLRRVLAHLLTNAGQYTAPGGKICLAAEVVDAGVVLRVSDNGIGIAPDLLPRIFDPFRRGRRPDGHLGVGLALARSLVELEGGSIAAFSDGPGTGAEFLVRILTCDPRIHDDYVPEAFAAVYSAAAVAGPAVLLAGNWALPAALAAVAISAAVQAVRRRRSRSVDRWQAALDMYVAREIARERRGEPSPG
jgi:hypothetical protein